MGVPLGTPSFKSFFIQDTLLKNVRHVDLLPILGDVQVAFGILIHWYVQHPSYLLRCTSPSPTFINSIISFDFSSFQVFGRLLGPRFFNNLERPLAYKQTSFPIIIGGINLILIATINPTTYLRNWALITLIIMTRFMFDQHPFLFKALT